MAGCKPEYFNIVLTAVEAMLDPAFNVNTAATSTGGAAICVIVSGPGRGRDRDERPPQRARLGQPGQRHDRPRRAPHRRQRARRQDRQARCLVGRSSRQVHALLRREPAGAAVAAARRREGATAPTTRRSRSWPPRVRDRSPTSSTSARGRAAVVRRGDANARRRSSSARAARASCVLGHEHALAVHQAGWTKQQAREFLAEHSRIAPDELDGGWHPHRDRGPARHDAGARRQAPDRAAPPTTSCSSPPADRAPAGRRTCRRGRR